MGQINCQKCKHYQVTYDPGRPRGCRVFGFKGKDYPSVTVKRETGEDCVAFELRPSLNDRKKGSDELG